MIRPLKESDIPTIRNIYENANNANDLPVEVDYFKKDALKYVSETIYKCENAVFEIEGSVKGIISVSKDFIEGLFVDPDHFRTGIGQKLLEFFLSRKDRLYLNVYSNNFRALGFYKKNGFVISGCGICPLTGLNYLEMVFEKDINSIMNSGSRILFHQK